jgi:two-component system NtrC family sensor kinase
MDVAFYHSASARLLVPLLLTIVVVVSVYGFLGFRAMSQEWNESVYSYARKFGELAKSATKHGMLVNRKDDVQYVVQLIGDSPGVEALNIYNKHGSVAFSHDPTKIGQQVDMQAEACVVCHEKGAPLKAVDTENRTRVYRNSLGRRVFGVIVPIENEPQCAQGGCHGPVAEQSILGIMDVQMSLESLDLALGDARRRSFWLTLAVMVVVSGGTIALVYRIVRRPVVKLVEGTQRIAQGDLDTRIDVTSRDELGQLAAAFNGMTSDLHKARAEANQWSQQLEQKVVEKTAELGRIQRQVLLMEKMASLGKLAATVAHELNNPLGGILNYAKLVERVLRDETLDEAGKRDVQHYLTAIQQESRRSGDIVRNLLLFARPSRTRFAPVRMSQIVDRSLLLINHRLAMSSIRCEYLPPKGDDLLTCDPDQIQQVLVALLVNAVEAMEEGGVLRLAVTPQPGLIELVVSDTGVGIPEDAIGHIFEPFFSTKDKESGVGLGLAVVYGIVCGHSGTIDVTSEPGKGATFTVRLPRNPAPTDNATEDSNVPTES